AFNEVLARLTSSWTQVEMGIGAVTGIGQFVLSTNQEDDGSALTTMVSRQVARGALRSESVTASYG
ncbi:hypothetical protein EJ03DRAFT_264207, partial [Teratosphaeria nubilosa]